MRQLHWWIFLAVALTNSVLNAQTVWPGDVNNNGIVNSVDLLYWGVAFGAQGPARAEADADFEPKPLPADWSQSFANGLNYVYADCDGNGIVDENDFDEAIDEHFGLVHRTPGADGYANGTNPTGPRIRLQPSATLVPEGAQVEILLFLDDADQPIDQFYGMAMAMQYTPGLVNEGDGIDFELEANNWIRGADQSLVQEVFEDNEDNGRAEFGITRTNQMGVTVGSQPIGRFSVIMEDIIVGRPVDTFILQIDSILVTSPGLESIAVLPDTTRIIVAKDTAAVVSSTAPAPSGEDWQPQFKIYPVPAWDHLFIEAPSRLEKLVLLNPQGQPLASYTPLSSDGHRYRLRLNTAYPPGIYWLQLWTPKMVLNRKIIICRK